jgi:hypothetical protein
MTLIIQIPPETEQRLKNAAARLGIDESECAKRLIERGLPSVESVGASHSDEQDALAAGSMAAIAGVLEPEDFSDWED